MFRIADLVFSVSVVSVFIGIFFFTYGAWLEKQIMLKQIGIIMQSLKQDLDYMNPALAQSLKMSAQVSASSSQQNTAADNAAAEVNRKLITQAAIILAVIGIVGVSIATYFMRKEHREWGPFLRLNAVALLFVALTYWSFSTFIIGNYQYADPNAVKLEILKNL